MNVSVPVVALFAFVSFACLVCKTPARQGGGLGGAVIQGCEIDLRPTERREAQVYYHAFEGTPFGTEFEIQVPMGDALEVSSWDATATPVKLQAGGPNVIRLEINTSTTPPTAKLIVKWPNGTERLNVPTRYQGSYDPLGAFQDPPVITSVLHPDPDKGRIRVTSTTHGVSVAFTLSDV